MSDMEDSRPAKSEPLDNAPLFVSLYVVLLAFFILLNSISKFDQKKVEDAMQSVDETFSVSRKLQAVPMVPKSVGADLSVTEFFDQTRKQVATAVPLEKIEEITSGNLMFLAFPTSYLFRPGAVALNPEAAPMVEKLAQHLQKWMQGMRIETELLVGYNQDLPLPAGAKNAIEVAQAGLFARRLEELGVQSKAIAVGVKQGYAGTTILTFKVRDREKSQLNLGIPKKDEPKLEIPAEAQPQPAEKMP